MTARVPMVSAERARELGDAMGMPARRTQSEAFRTVAESRSVAGRIGEAGFILTPEHFRILRAILARALG